MKKPIFFCKSWFRAKKRPTEIWSEDKARLAHSAKQTYTVLVDSVDEPYCFIDVSDGAVGVGFLDEFLRESLTYSFQVVEPGKLFLAMAIHREFDGNTDTVSKGVTYFFETNGSVEIKRESFNPHRIEKARSTLDINSNYSKVPDFGNYDDLIRVERS